MLLLLLLLLAGTHSCSGIKSQPCPCEVRGRVFHLPHRLGEVRGLLVPGRLRAGLLLVLLAAVLVLLLLPVLVPVLPSHGALSRRGAARAPARAPEVQGAGAHRLRQDGGLASGVDHGLDLRKHRAGLEEGLQLLLADPLVVVEVGDVAQVQLEAGEERAELRGVEAERRGDVPSGEGLPELGHFIGKGLVKACRLMEEIYNEPLTTHNLVLNSREHLFVIGVALHGLAQVTHLGLNPRQHLPEALHPPPLAHLFVLCVEVDRAGALGHRRHGCRLLEPDATSPVRGLFGGVGFVLEVDARGRLDQRQRVIRDGGSHPEAPE
mmetsp:Transcript_117535/g.333074  ORF Transcript_117535/g.333074 Transcript_117535/m.333074 type:complete len:322 (+) Transcript_117535:18-983(+)